MSTLFGDVADAGGRTSRAAPAVFRRSAALAFNVLPGSVALDVLPAWAALAVHSVGDNVFFHPDFAVPALRHLGVEVSLATVTAADRRLVALAPFTRMRLGRVAPAARFWAHDYAPLGLPLVDEASVADAVPALLDGLAPSGSGLSLIAADLPIE
ncbi:MAG TPA: hypothetical protein VG894_01860, partial [Bauldia sp.]|nr:hypothetical protein [Bauldia sp.]